VRYRSCLAIAVACAAFFAPAAGAVVLKTGSGHRVSLKFRSGHSAAAGLGAVTTGTTGAQAPSVGDVRWRGGPVLHSADPYLVYWAPAGHTIPSSSRTVLTRYMSDVAADSGGVDNVYGVLTQYTDSAGPAAYAQTFGSAQVINDTHRYPANNGGCSVDPGTTACVSDAQLQAEVARLVSADRLPSGVGPGAPIYFVVTPQDVNVCFAAGQCSTNVFCAYHSFFMDGGNPVLYSSVPFTVWANGSTKGCQDDGTALYQTPDQGSQALFHGDHAYQIADNLSHELSETITDPLLNAWFNNNGSEVGDLCEAFAPASKPEKDVSAHAYFPIVAGTESASDLVDQFFSGDYYYNQTEWSNATGDCMATPTT